MSCGLCGLLWGHRSFGFESHSDKLGRFEISEFALSPRLYLQEPGLGGFELRESWIGFEWSRDEYIRGVLNLGSRDLTEPAVWMTPNANRAEFGVSEAWMEGRSLYGDLRAGFVRIPQAYEGQSAAWAGLLPSTRARRMGWFIRRDFGLQFLWKSDRWDTSLTVHNGESGTNTDGKYALTSHWGYRVPGGLSTLVTATVMNTKPASTSGSLAASQYKFVFNPNEDAKIRQGSWALYKEGHRELFLLEIGKGEILQKEEKESFGWGHFDSVINWGGDFSFLFRAEITEANQKQSDTFVKSAGAGFSISSKARAQSVTFFANHLEEKPDVQSDEFWMIFRIHSLLADQE